MTIWYATFLQSDRNDKYAAEAFYKRALDVDSSNPNTLGNYAGLLFVLGRTAEGRTHLEAAEDLPSRELALDAELAFYRAAHLPGDWPISLAKLKQLLVDGARSAGWSLDENANRARKDGHPDPELLAAIAAVISNGEALDSLDRYPNWVAAKPL